MKLPVVFRDEAQCEFDEAFDWYDARRVGLGPAFVAAVEAVLDAVAAQPLVHATCFADIRKAVVRRFPYCVYYRPRDDRLEVVAVFHTSRDPAIWQARV